MKKKRKNDITEAEVRDAVHRFRQRGGIIRKLPPQIVPPNLMVGANYAQYDLLGFHYNTTQWPV